MARSWLIQQKQTLTVCETREAEYRTTPGRVILHVPPVSGLERITLNCSGLICDGKSRTVNIV
jgi:hypothetical protein